MRVIFDDILQYSDATDTLKSPALADISTFQTTTINLDKSRTFDCIGIGNTTASTVIINGQSVAISSTQTNGLYSLTTPITATAVSIVFPASTSVGRIALGMGRKLGASPAREPGFWSTAKPRVTLSGQTIQGVGGVTGRVLSVDFRYKFTREIFEDIEAAFPTQLGRGFPVFIDFPNTTGQNRFPWVRFYGVPDKKWIFQSSVNRFLYSKKLKLKEAF